VPLVSDFASAATQRRARRKAVAADKQLKLQTKLLDQAAARKKQKDDGLRAKAAAKLKDEEIQKRKRREAARWQEDACRSRRKSSSAAPRTSPLKYVAACASTGHHGKATALQTQIAEEEPTEASAPDV